MKNYLLHLEQSVVHVFVSNSLMAVVDLVEAVVVVAAVAVAVAAVAAVAVVEVDVVLVVDHLDHENLSVHMMSVTNVVVSFLLKTKSFIGIYSFQLRSWTLCL